MTAPARVLIIAGSDSGGGAGIQADIKTITMLGGYAMTAITALTAQNTLGVERVMQVPAAMVVAQLDSCVTDLGVDAIKIGMIGSAETANAVADYLERLCSRDGGNPGRAPGVAGAQSLPIVFDPVMVATSGSVLADEATIAAFGRLMRVATLTTPNLPELEALGGEAAVLDSGSALLAKGGHATGAMVEDTLITPDGGVIFANPRIETRHTHGTGCTLSSAIATGLGQGLSLDRSVERGIAFVRAAIAHAPGLGQGSGPMGHALGRAPFDEGGA